LREKGDEMAKMFTGEELAAAVITGNRVMVEKIEELCNVVAIAGCEIERLRAESNMLREVLKGADEYLDTNKLTNIAHGSILHQQFKTALAKSA
jgi:hypothetical protein